MRNDKDLLHFITFVLIYAIGRYCMNHINIYHVLVLSQVYALAVKYIPTYHLGGSIDLLTVH